MSTPRACVAMHSSVCSSLSAAAGGMRSYCLAYTSEHPWTSNNWTWACVRKRASRRAPTPSLSE
jgi:hypothetical protein